ncbi:hypothetical protein GCM10025865_12720 [Paraoerskovia sediminicola]|uniref:Fibronectin type-III domain-containing protein n=1 Tax=Paraoerskovia sediminicola TaxID=1138587 RepID=A0ABM8G1X2_9CELL|nr:RICIN domain-containing protein [Paraoerskovia sediminicola]BDZ41973.1 hypothetical protein GCM10025865_12720 [Paraoerskovia sediminicola]
MRNWSKTMINWNLALDSSGGPVNGGCGEDPKGMCSGVLTIDGTSVSKNAEYYALGHLSKFVSPGAVRVASNNAGDLHNVAFKNPDGTVALYVTNVGGGTQTFGVSWNGKRVGYTVAPGAVATLTWPSTGGSTSDTQAPSAPAGLTASGTSTSATNLSWNASNDDVGVTGYVVRRDGTQVATPSGTSFRDSGLSADTEYSYTVAARDAAGNESARSSVLTVRTDAPDTQAPSAPAGLTASGTSTSGTNLSWSASSDDVGVTGYVVRRDGTQVATPSGTSFRDSGLSADTEYSYTVAARDAAGNESAASSPLVVRTSQAPEPGGPIDQTAWYQVINANSGKCLDDADWSTSNGARLQQWGCNTPVADNQQWQFRATSDGYYQVVNRHAESLVWDVAGGSGATGNGTDVHLWEYAGGVNQQWMPTEQADGTYTFVARHSGKCLDVRDVSTSNGAGLQQWACTGGPAQAFSIVEQ